MTVLEATTIKQLGIDGDTAKQIVRLYKEGENVRSIADEVGVARRRVMQALNIKGLTNYAPGSFA